MEDAAGAVVSVISHDKIYITDTYNKTTLQNGKENIEMAKNIHVVPKGDRWAVKIEGIDKPLSSHRTQELARQSAVPIAKDKKSEVVIHGRDGKIRDKDSYGSDPNPPKDAKH